METASHIFNVSETFRRKRMRKPDFILSISSSGTPVFRSFPEGSLGPAHRTMPLEVPRPKVVHTHDEYQRGVRPVTLLLRLLGVWPITTLPTGEASFSTCSWDFVYSVMLLSVLLATTLLMMVERIKRLNDCPPPLPDLLHEIGIYLCYGPVFVAPFCHLLEARKKATYLNRWMTLQAAYRRVTGRHLSLPLGRKVCLKLMVSVAMMVNYTSLLFLIRKGFTWWQGIPFATSTLLNALASDYWTLTTHALVLTSRSLQMEVSQQVNVAGKRLEELESVWRHLSSTAREMGHAMGYTYGGHILFYAMLMLTGTFGLISQIKTGNLFNIFAFVGTIIIFYCLTFLLCDAAEKATSAVGEEFQEHLQVLECHLPAACSDVKTQLRLFVDTVVKNPPIISLCGFVQVNRALTISIMSALATYLVVLTQFQLADNSVQTIPESEQKRAREMRQIHPDSPHTLMAQSLQSLREPPKVQLEGFLRDVTPVARALKVLGILPFYFAPTGGAKLVIVSPIMIYTLVTHLTIFVVAGFIFNDRIRWLRLGGLEFSTIMLEATYLVSIIPLFLLPFAQLPELCSRATFFEKWNHLQVGYRELTGKGLEVGMQRQCRSTLFCMIVISIVICSFPHTIGNRGAPIWHDVAFGYSLLLSCLLSTIWILNATALQKVSKIMAENVQQELMQKRLDRVEQFRFLWLELCGLTRLTGNAMGFTYGTHMLMYFVEQVLTVYSLLTNTRYNFLSVSTLVFSVAALIFSGLIFLICNSAQCATEEVGSNFLEKLQIIGCKIPLEHKETRKEVRIFIETIVENPPIITFSGFVTVNRGLQTSFMSAMVTYLVVLIQFSMSAESSKGNNNTSATSD